MKSRIALVAALALPCLTGCVNNAVSSAGQAALDSTAQTVMAAVINNNPTDFAGFVAVYPMLYTIASGGVTSYQLGQSIAAVKGGPSSKGAADLVSALDGVVRNAIAAQGGSAKTPSMAQAIAQQVIDVWADGFWHALNVYAGMHGLPAVPQVVPTTVVVPAPAPAPTAATSTGNTH